MDHLWLALLWIAYFTLHSILALIPVKNFFLSLGLKPQAYRLFYVIFATLSLFCIVLYSAMIKSDYIISSNKILKLLGLILAGWGFIIAKEGFRSYDTKAFLGLGNLKAEDEFKTDGLLKKIRHPLYSGSILLVIGYFLFDPKTTTLISVSLVII
jgi:methanethiol S-methyltransferase